MPGHANFVGGPAARIRRKLSGGSSSQPSRRRNSLSLGLGLTGPLAKPKPPMFDFTWAPSSVPPKRGAERKTGSDERARVVDPDASAADDEAEAKRRKGITQLLDEDLGLGGFQAGREALLAMDDWAGLRDDSILKPSPPPHRASSKKPSTMRKHTSSSPIAKSRVSTIPEEDEYEDEDERSSEMEDVRSYKDQDQTSAYTSGSSSPRRSDGDDVIVHPTPRRSTAEQPLFSLDAPEHDSTGSNSHSPAQTPQYEEGPPQQHHQIFVADTVDRDPAAVVHPSPASEPYAGVASGRSSPQHHSANSSSPANQPSGIAHRSAVDLGKDPSVVSEEVMGGVNEQQPYAEVGENGPITEPSHYSSSSSAGPNNNEEAHSGSLKRKEPPPSSSSVETSAGSGTRSTSTDIQTKRPRRKPAQRVSLRLAGPPQFYPQPQRNSPVEPERDEYESDPVDPVAPLAGRPYPPTTDSIVRKQADSIEEATMEVPELPNPFKSLSAALGLEDISGIATPVQHQAPSEAVSDEGQVGHNLPPAGATARAEKDIFAEDDESTGSDEGMMVDQENHRDDETKSVSSSVFAHAHFPPFDSRADDGWLKG